MLLAVSVIASTIALMGVLLVASQTRNTIASMPALKDPRTPLTAFPRDVVAAANQQDMTSTGVAPSGPAIPPTKQQAEDLRDALADAKGDAAQDAADKGTDAGAVDGQQPQPASADAPALAKSQLTQGDVEKLAAQLEALLLADNNAPNTASAKGATSTDPQADTQPGEVRDYALRELTAPDGSINLPHYDINLDQLTGGQTVGMLAKVADQIGQLQDALSSEVSKLPELQGKQVGSEDIQLTDPNQLDGALKALRLQAKLLGVQLPTTLRYESLRSLGDSLLSGSGSGAKLEGLNMDDLESVSRDLLNQLNLHLEENTAPPAR